LRYVKGPPPKGWRFNDLTTEILYAAEVEALATLEVAVRPGWESMQQVLIATIEIPDGSLANLSDLKIPLPSNWNSRPATDDSRLIAREFLNTIASSPAAARPIGLRVPSVLSTTDFNVLLDPSRKSEMSAASPAKYRLIRCA
jgi:RES domain-containing protein